MILGSVLNREVGDASVMCEQMDHLLAVGGRPSVMIQVVPDTPEVAGALGGAFAIATEGAADVAAYTDSIVKGGVYTDPDQIARAARRVRWPARGRATVDADPGSYSESRRAMDALNWRKASYSASNGGCVEVAGHSDRVLVRDTQDRPGPVLRFGPAAWRVFAERVKRSLAPGPVRVGWCS